MDNDTPLGEARQWLRTQARAQGAPCPCCTQFAKVYRRKINSGMARALITCYLAAGLDWFHKPTVLRGVGAAARDESLLRFWGLFEPERTTAPTGRTGYWRVTPDGERFIRNGLAVPRYARVYDDRCLGLVGPPTDIRTALGARFDLDELLALRDDT